MNALTGDNIEVVAHQTSKHDKPFCGDSYFFTMTDDYFVCVLADGLGSGEFAYESSAAVIEIVKENHHESVDALMKLANHVLRQKRGAAVTIFKIFFHTKEFVYSCVGNIRFFMYSPKGKLTYPLPVTGYLSGRPQIFHTQRFPYEPYSKFILFSDGYEFQGVKSLLRGLFPVRMIADEIIHHHPKSDDDATFIIGSLL